MKLLITATLTALTFWTSAQASHGSDQLAASLGVEPNRYSLSQLTLLKSLRSEDNNGFWISEVLEHPEGEGGNLITHHRTELDKDAAGWQSLARSLGVAPGQYSPQELVQLKSAISDDDQPRIAFIKSGGSAASNRERSQGSDGAAQLARSLGLEPGLYSLGQLTRLKTFDGDSESLFLIRQILENPDFG